MHTRMTWPGCTWSRTWCSGVYTIHRICVHRPAAYAYASIRIPVCLTNPWTRTYIILKSISPRMPTQPSIDHARSTPSIQPLIGLPEADWPAYRPPLGRLHPTWPTGRASGGPATNRLTGGRLGPTRLAAGRLYRILFFKFYKKFVLFKKN